MRLTVPKHIDDLHCLRKRTFTLTLAHAQSRTMHPNTRIRTIKELSLDIDSKQQHCQRIMHAAWTTIQWNKMNYNNDDDRNDWALISNRIVISIFFIAACLNRSIKKKGFNLLIFDRISQTAIGDSLSWIQWRIEVNSSHRTTATRYCFFFFHFYWNIHWKKNPVISRFYRQIEIHTVHSV